MADASPKTDFSVRKVFATSSQVLSGAGYAPIEVNLSCAQPSNIAARADGLLRV
jgi:hypothetical protein